jgi:hypothetical protein
MRWRLKLFSRGWPTHLFGFLTVPFIQLHRLLENRNKSKFRHKPASSTFKSCCLVGARSAFSKDVRCRTAWQIITCFNASGTFWVGNLVSCVALLLVGDWHFISNSVSWRTAKLNFSEISEMAAAALELLSEDILSLLLNSLTKYNFHELYKIPVSFPSSIMFIKQFQDC